MTYKQNITVKQERVQRGHMSDAIATEAFAGLGIDAFLFGTRTGALTLLGGPCAPSSP